MAYKVIRSNGDYRLYLTLTRGTANVAGNYTPVTVRLYLKKNSGTNWAGVYASDSRTWSWSGSGITNRSGSYVFDFRGTKANYGEILLRNETFNVAHNSDGTRGKLTVSATVNFAPSTIANSVSISESVSFTTIPRASTMSLGGATRTNASITVSISRKSSSFTHNVRYKVGSGSWVSVSSSATTSASFTVQPSQLPNAKSATVTVGVQTKSGSTNIGSEVTATRTITIPNSTISLSGTAQTNSAQSVSVSNSGGSLSYTYSWKLGSATGGNSSSWTPPHSALPTSVSGVLTCTVVTKNGTATINTASATKNISVPSSLVPTISSVTATEMDTTTAGLGLSNKYVQYKSRVKITVSANGISGSTIPANGYKITVDGQSLTTNNATTLALRNSGTLTCTVVVTDSRGRKSSSNTALKLSVLPYNRPMATGMIANRVDVGGNVDLFGTSSNIRFKTSGTSLDGKNTLAYKVDYRVVGGSWVNVLNVSASNSNMSVSVTKDTYGVFERTKEYQYRIIITDKYESRTFATDDIYIPTAGVNLAVGYGGVATSIGKLASHGDTYNLEVGDKGLRVDGPIIDKNGAEPLAFRGPLPSGDTRENSYWMTMENGIWYLDGDTSRVQGIPAGSWGTLVKTTANNTGIGTSIFEVVYTSHNRGTGMHDRWIITGNGQGISPWRRISMEGHTHSASNITSGTIADARLPAKAKPADFVVERGSNYAKWNSGKLECWEKFPTSTTSYTSRTITGGHIMYRVWTFPKAFVDSNVHVFVSGDASGWALDSTGNWGETSTQCHVGLMSVSPITEVRLQAYAIGRWK